MWRTMKKDVEKDSKNDGWITKLANKYEKLKSLDKKSEFNSKESQYLRDVDKLKLKRYVVETNQAKSFLDPSDTSKINRMESFVQKAIIVTKLITDLEQEHSHPHSCLKCLCQSTKACPFCNNQNVPGFFEHHCYICNIGVCKEVNCISRMCTNLKRGLCKYKVLVCTDCATNENANENLIKMCSCAGVGTPIEKCCFCINDCCKTCNRCS
eukprot:Awhi_evm1s11014